MSAHINGLCACSFTDRCPDDLHPVSRGGLNEIAASAWWPNPFLGPDYWFIPPSRPRRIVNKATTGLRRPVKRTRAFNAAGPWWLIAHAYYDLLAQPRAIRIYPPS